MNKLGGLSLKAWKKGAIIGFVFIPFWFSIGSFLMMLAGIIPSEAIRWIISALFMLITFPPAIILQRLGITHIKPILALASIPFWTVIGALIGHLIDRRNPSSSG